MAHVRMELFCPWHGRRRWRSRGVAHLVELASALVMMRMIVSVAASRIEPGCALIAACRMAPIVGSAPVIVASVALTAALPVAPAAAAAFGRPGPSSGILAASGDAFFGMSPEDQDRIFFWQPLLASSLIIFSIGYLFFSSRKASDARDARLLKEVDLDEIRSARLAGKAGEDEVLALEEEVATLCVAEMAAAEFFGWGEDTATTRRTSFFLRTPPSEVSRAAAARKGKKATGLDAELRDIAYQSDDWTTIVLFLVGFFALLWLLLVIAT
mmetsp:Transcript_105676/g.268501  ORF Transcript_105676/g.268501 Transcript_105676/m.268501 type:complete len:270 (-) Transcript_105676:51-860(-)